VGAPAEGLYALRPDAKQLSEAELRKLVSARVRALATQRPHPRLIPARTHPPASPHFLLAGWLLCVVSCHGAGRHPC
jgi:hypothetical protein